MTFGGAILFFDVYISARLLAFECAISCPISLWGLKLACFEFSEARLPRSRSFSDVAKAMGKQTWFRFQGFREGWNLLTAGLGFSLPWKIFQKAAMEVVDFSVDVCSGFLGHTYKRRIRGKNPSENPPAENKNSADARSPRNPPARPKNPPQNLPTNPSPKPSSTRGFFSDWEGLLLEASSEHGFWDNHWLLSGHGWGSHAEMHLQPLSCCWWEGQGLLHTLPDNT